jgi:hypothetical protein
VLFREGAAGCGGSVPVCGKTVQVCDKPVQACGKTVPVFGKTVPGCRTPVQVCRKTVQVCGATVQVCDKPGSFSRILARVSRPDRHPGPAAAGLIGSHVSGSGFLRRRLWWGEDGFGRRAGGGAGVGGGRWGMRAVAIYGAVFSGRFAPNWRWSVAASAPASGA